MSGVGIVLGGVFSVLTQGLGIFKSKEERLDKADQRRHEQAMAEHEYRMGELQSQRDVSLTEQHIARAHVDGSWKGLEESIKAQAITADSSYRWANSIVTLVRPVMTLALFAITAWSAVKGVEFALNEGMLDNALGVNNAKLLSNIIGDNEALAVIYTLTETCVTWWFGDRSFRRNQMSSALAGNIRAAGRTFEGGQDFEIE